MPSARCSSCGSHSQRAPGEAGGKGEPIGRRGTDRLGVRLDERRRVRLRGIRCRQRAREQKQDRSDQGARQHLAERERELQKDKGAGGECEVGGDGDLPVFWLARRGACHGRRRVLGGGEGGGGRGQLGRPRQRPAGTSSCLVLPRRSSYLSSQVQKGLIARVADRPLLPINGPPRLARPARAVDLPPLPPPNGTSASVLVGEQAM